MRYEMSWTEAFIKHAESAIYECEGTHDIRFVDCKMRTAMADALTAIAADLHEIRRILAAQKDGERA